MFWNRTSTGAAGAISVVETTLGGIIKDYIPVGSYFWYRWSAAGVANSGSISIDQLTITFNYGNLPGGENDPHFNGFRGQKFDINGESGHIYNIISTPTVQMNSLFMHYPLIKKSDATWMSVVGVKHSGNEILVDAINKTVQLNGEEVKVSAQTIKIAEDLTITRTRKDKVLIRAGDFIFTYTLVTIFFSL